jgi:hypothetical protein
MLVILILISVIIKQLYPNPPENTLVKTFNDSGAKLVNWEIYFRGKINNDSDEFNSIEELETLAEKFSEDLGITKKNYSTNIDLSNDLIHIVDIEGFVNDKRTVISLNLERSHENPIEKYISVSIINDAMDLNLVETRKKLESIFNKYGIKPKINICITGSFRGKLDKEELAEVCENILLGAKAKRIEEMNASNMISISAYSPSISNSIQAAGKKVNINLAIRYNSYENRTYIWLASPVIERSY